jgi:hypothetical protein
VTIMHYPQRALQLWSLLALAAMTRTILTYDDVSALTGLPTDSAKTLGYVYFYCAQYKLPLLSSLVVRKEDYKPSSDLYDKLDIRAEQRRCFAHDWLKQPVPSPDEFETAHAAKAGLNG